MILNLRISNKANEQLKDLQSSLKLSSRIEVIRMALVILSYAEKNAVDGVVKIGDDDITLF